MKHVVARNFSLLFFSCIFCFFVFAAPVSAQSGAIPTANAPVINLSIGIGGTRTVSDLAQYIGVLYKWMVGAALVISAFMIAVGGFQYVASAGIPKMVSTAKTRIRNSLIGLLLVLGSYVLLYSINPAFTELKLPAIRKIQKIVISTGMCPNTGDFVDRFKCGDPYTSKDGAPIPSGSTCIGQGQCGTGQCLDYKDPTTGAQKYGCLQASQCPSSCAAIEGMAPGSGWIPACGSSVCNTVIPGGCYVNATPSPASSAIIYTCNPRKQEGERCSENELCQATLVCSDETGTCLNVFASLPDGRRCTLDKQCKSGICDQTAQPDAQGRFTCMLTGGLQTNGAVCYKSSTDQNGSKFCGDGFVCVSTGQGSAIGDSGVCSDRGNDQACFPAAGFDCSDAADECVYDEASNHGVCRPKQAAPAGTPNS